MSVHSMTAGEIACLRACAPASTIEMLASAMSRARVWARQAPRSRALLGHCAVTKPPFCSPLPHFAARALGCYVRAAPMLKLTPSILEGLPKTGPTDPIEYYRRPLVGWIFRQRINMGLGMLADNRYERALEVGYGAGAVLLAIAPQV